MFTHVLATQSGARCKPLIYRACTVHQCHLCGWAKIKCSLDGNPFLSLSYISPIAARKISMLHLMQDLLHWAHKLALYGLLKLGCVYNFDYMKKLLQILRENRLEKGISQEYLAGKLGVSSSTISRWESI